MKENETEREGGMEGEREGWREREDFCCWWFDMMMRFRVATPYSIGRHCLTQAIIFRCDN